MSNFSAKEFECKCGCGLGSGGTDSGRRYRSRVIGDVG